LGTLQSLDATPDNTGDCHLFPAGTTPFPVRYRCIETRQGEYRMPVFFIMWAAAIVLLGGGVYFATYM
jgi:hypothetical protein